jgi:hypothetical protein
MNTIRKHLLLVFAASFALTSTVSTYAQESYLNKSIAFVKKHKKKIMIGSAIALVVTIGYLYRGKIKNIFSTSPKTGNTTVPSPELKVGKPELKENSTGNTTVPSLDKLELKENSTGNQNPAPQQPIQLPSTPKLQEKTSIIERIKNCLEVVKHPIQALKNVQLSEADERFLIP